MPTVPRYDNFQVGQQGGNAGRFATPQGPQADALGARQLQEAGQAVQGAAQGLGRLALDAQEQANQVRVNDALNKAVTARLTLTHDQGAGYTHLQGEQALKRPDGKPLDQEWGERLDQAFADISAELGNDAQRLAFGQRASQLAAEFRGQVQAHVSKAFEQFKLGELEGRVAAGAKLMTTEWDNPASVAAGQGAVRSAVAQRFAGQAPEFMAAKTAEALTPLHLAVLDRLMMRSVDQAQVYAKDNDGELTVKARADVDAALDRRSAEVRSGTAVRELTAAPNWTVAGVDRALVQRLADKPEELKLARAELAYQDQLRTKDKADEQRRLLAPVNTLLGDALAAGRSISSAQREQAVGGLRTTAPDLYRQASELVDRHNDEIRNEQRAAEAHARSLASHSVDGQINALALRYDMLLNPGKYRTADLSATLFPLVRDGKLSAAAVNDAITLQDHLRRPEKQDDFASLMTGGQYLENRLAGAVIDGKPFAELHKDKQREIHTRALALAEPLLQGLQQGKGGKASRDEVKQVIDSLFVTKHYRDAFMGFGYGKATPTEAFAPEQAPQRLNSARLAQVAQQIPPFTRDRIERALRSNGQAVTPEAVAEVYLARPR